MLVGLLLLACAGGEDDSGAPAGDGGAADGGATVDGGAADGGAGDGGTADGGTVPGTAAVSALSWALDDDIGSIGVVSWTQDEAVDAAWVEFQVGEEGWRQGRTLTGEAGARSALVLGVPYDTEVQYRVVNQVGDEKRTSTGETGQTDPLPTGLVNPSASTPLPDALEPGLVHALLSLSTPEDAIWKLVVDRQGRIVWAHESAGNTGSMHVSVDGSHIIWDERGKRSDVHRMTLDGEILETVELPGMHHSFTEAADRALVWGGTDEDGDEVVRERAADGSVRELFDCTAWWQAHGATIPCDGNAVTWLPEDDTIYFSSDNETTVVHLDRATGEVLATFGTLDGSWSFAAGSSRFYKQHSPKRTPEGNLLVSSQLTGNDRTMVAREYSLDAEDEVLTEVWTCDPGSGIHADHGGETWRLDGGNTLLNYGPGASLREYTPDCALAWELTWPEETTLSRLTVLADLYALVE